VQLKQSVEEYLGNYPDFLELAGLKQLKEGFGSLLANFDPFWNIAK
jgi:hypothetical protein